MLKIKRLTLRLARRLKQMARLPKRRVPLVQSADSRSALNASIAGRRWNGQLFQPTPHANAAAWGFGFSPPAAGLDSLAIPLGRHCFGQKIRVRIWRAPGLKRSHPFRPPGSGRDRLVYDRIIEAVASVQGEPIAQFCRIDLSGVKRWQQCLHLVELRFAEEPRSPLAVGRSTSDGPWSWECGWVHLKHREPVPLERPWGIAWASYGKMPALSHGRSVAQGKVEVSGVAEVQGFRLSLPAVSVIRTSQTIDSAPVELLVPEPRFVDQVAAPSVKNASPPAQYRHAERLEECAEGESAQGVKYRCWAARYDLVSVDRDSGRLALTLGQERFLDPEEFRPELPAMHLPVYSLYTTKNGVEVIPLWDWQDLVRADRRAEHLLWVESSRKRLARTFRKLRSAGTIRLAGYGDSLTSLGGRDASLIHAPNGPFRDTLGYFEKYGEDWKRSVPLFSTAANGPAVHHRLGWNWHLKEAMETSYPVEVEYLNWGIPGTTSEPNRRNVNGQSYPNGADSDRLKRLLDSGPDLVTVSFGMNDIGEQIRTYSNVRRICDVIGEAGVDVVVVGLCQQNAGFGSRDHALWRLTHDHIAAAAHDSGVAYIPTWEIFGDGNEGATGLSRWSHSAASMTNHPGASELAYIGRFMAKIIV